jgi:hypothetical protein
VTAPDGERPVAPRDAGSVPTWLMDTLRESPWWGIATWMAFPLVGLGLAISGVVPAIATGGWVGGWLGGLLGIRRTRLRRDPALRAGADGG